MDSGTPTINSTTSIVECTPKYDGSSAAKAAKIGVYLALILVSILGNVLVLCVVYGKDRMWNVKNFFITNLGGSDLLISVFCMPFVISHEFLLDNWIYGTAMCKMVPFLQNMSVASSVLTLLAIAIDRFTAIGFIRGPRLNMFRAKIAVFIIWLTALAIAAPILYTQRVVTGPGGYEICVEDWTPLFNPRKASKNYTLLLFTTLYLAPLITMVPLYTVLCYKLWHQKPLGEAYSLSSNKHRATKKKAMLMLITVTIAFAVSWLPYWVFNLSVYFAHSHSCLSYNVNVFFTIILFGHANSAMNPIFYSFLSVNFRKGFKQACCCSGQVTRPCSQRQRALCTRNNSANTYPHSVRFSTRTSTVRISGRNSSRRSETCHILNLKTCN